MQCGKGVQLSKRNRILMILGVLLIALLSSMPLFAPGIEGRWGQDLGFHLMRIEGIAAELENGVFPVKMQSLWMDGYGYPVSVYYGDLLLYFPAILRLLGVPVVLAYKIFVAACNLGTAALCFFCFRIIFEKDLIALAASAAYCLAGYRLVNLYVRAAVGEYCAMMFLPLVAMAVYRIYRAKELSCKQQVVLSGCLALGLSGILGTHLLTLEMTGILLLLMGLVCWKKTFTKEVLSTLTLALGETILLNLYFLIPFLDYSKNTEVYINRKLGKASLIQGKGADLSQLFGFFSSPFHQGEESSYLPVTPGILLMAVCLVALILLLLGRLKKESKFFLGFSLGLLFVSSKFFPWDALASAGKVGELLTQVQFPWRYMGLAVLMLSLLLGSLLREIGIGKENQGKQYPGQYRGMIGAVLLLAVVTPVVFTLGYTRDYQQVYYETREDLNTYDMGMIEYLRYGTKREELTGEIQGENLEEAECILRRGTTMEIYVKCREKAGAVELPIMNYPGYHVQDEDGNTYAITDGSNQVICVELPAGFEGTLTVTYREPWYWRAGEILSLGTLLAVWITAVWMKRRSRG